MHEAMFYEVDGDRLRCRLCPHGCVIAAGKRGRCGVRENRKGTLVALTYDHVSSLAADPVEKKPLYHVLPGSRALSFAAPGCNLSCLHCQNASLSQGPRERGALGGSAALPEAIVAAALEDRCEVLAATYSEPTIFFELALDVARIATRRGLVSVWVTNGFTGPQARDALIPFLDAANVDLKAWNEETYREVCGAERDPVLASIEEYRRRGVWVEVTTLVIPGLNDSDEELGAIASYLAGLDRHMPWHVSAFHPTYRMRDRPRTPAATLERAFAIGRRAGLHNVYTGNVEGGHDDTFCSACGSVVIRRGRLRLHESRLAEGRCPDCGAEVAGIFADSGGACSREPPRS